MQEFEQFMDLMRLKKVMRYGDNKDVADSTAEHLYGLMLLAEHFFKSIPDLDRHKVYQLILYHDLIEIESDDVCWEDEEGEKNKSRLEELCVPKVVRRLPNSLKEDFYTLFAEYVACETPEAKFVHAIDKLEPMFQCSLYEKDWNSRGSTEEEVRKRKGHYMEAFPVIKDFWETLLGHMKSEGYFG